MAARDRSDRSRSRGRSSSVAPCAGPEQLPEAASEAISLARETMTVAIERIAIENDDAVTLAQAAAVVKMVAGEAADAFLRSHTNQRFKERVARDPTFVVPHTHGKWAIVHYGEKIVNEADKLFLEELHGQSWSSTSESSDA